MIAHTCAKVKSDAYYLFFARFMLYSMKLNFSLGINMEQPEDKNIIPETYSDNVSYPSTDSTGYLKEDKTEPNPIKAYNPFRSNSLPQINMFSKPQRNTSGTHPASEPKPNEIKVKFERKFQDSMKIFIISITKEDCSGKKLEAALKALLQDSRAARHLIFFGGREDVNNNRELDESSQYRSLESLEPNKKNYYTKIHTKAMEQFINENLTHILRGLGLEENFIIYGMGLTQILQTLNVLGNIKNIKFTDILGITQALESDDRYKLEEYFGDLDIIKQNFGVDIKEAYSFLNNKITEIQSMPNAVTPTPTNTKTKKDKKAAKISANSATPEELVTKATNAARDNIMQITPNSFASNIMTIKNHSNGRPEQNTVYINCVKKSHISIEFENISKIITLEEINKIKSGIKEGNLPKESPNPAKAYLALCHYINARKLQGNVYIYDKKNLNHKLSAYIKDIFGIDPFAIIAARSMNYICAELAILALLGMLAPHDGICYPSKTSFTFLEKFGEMFKYAPKDTQVCNLLAQIKCNNITFHTDFSLQENIELGKKKQTLSMIQQLTKSSLENMEIIIETTHDDNVIPQTNQIFIVCNFYPNIVIAFNFKGKRVECDIKIMTVDEPDDMIIPWEIKVYKHGQHQISGYSLYTAQEPKHDNDEVHKYNFERNIANEILDFLDAVSPEHSWLKTVYNFTASSETNYTPATLSPEAKEFIVFSCVALLFQPELLKLKVIKTNVKANLNSSGGVSDDLGISTSKSVDDNMIMGQVIHSGSSGIVFFAATDASGLVPQSSPLKRATSGSYQENNINKVTSTITNTPK
jgi:hypothetical protein